MRQTPDPGCFVPLALIAHVDTAAGRLSKVWLGCQSRPHWRCKTKAFGFGEGWAQLYRDTRSLITSLSEVIAPADSKAEELRNGH